MTAIGRPPTYSIETHGDALCAELALGRSLRSVCRDEGMPSMTVVMGWLRLSPEFQQQYARAKDEAADALVEEMLDIADTPLEGVTEKFEMVKMPNPDDPELPDVEEFRIVERKVEDMLGHRKLQVDTRRWVASKLKPKKYGDRTQHEHTGKMTLESLVTGAAESTPE